MFDSDWLFPEAAVSVRQGDILLRREPSSGLALESCLVITADCDISKSKFGKQLACLRIDLLHDYVRYDWAQRKFNKLFYDNTERVRSQLAKWHTRSLGRASNLSAEAAEKWIRREATESICDSLEVPMGERKKLAASIGTYKAALIASDACANADALTRLVTFKAALSCKGIHECLKEILAQAQNESLPDDVFLLPSIPHTDKSAALVKLRELIAVDFDLIKYRATEADASKYYLRTGRLQPTLKYSISQKFGALYSKIGLPLEFEDRHRKAIESVSEIGLENL